jgi:hypothetical protein
MCHWRKILLLLPLVACTPDYPMDRPGTWSPGVVGTNDANLRTMLVNPRDLVAGAGEDTSTGAAAAAPVARLVAGKREPLPASNAAQFQIMAAPQAGGAGGAGGGGVPAAQ